MPPRKPVQPNLPKTSLPGAGTAGHKPAPSSRRMRGFESAAQLVAERIRAAGQSRGFAVSRVLTHWVEIVGEDIARMARPVKLGHAPRRGEGTLGATLTLLVGSAHAPVVQMQIPRIIERVNACYGHAAISRIAITQTSAHAPGAFAEAAAPFAPAPRRDPALTARAAAASDGVQDNALREALARLGERVLARAAGPAPSAPPPPAPACGPRP